MNDLATCLSQSGLVRKTEDTPCFGGRRGLLLGIRGLLDCWKSWKVLKAREAMEGKQTLEISSRSDRAGASQELTSKLLQVLGISKRSPTASECSSDTDEFSRAHQGVILKLSFASVKMKLPLEDRNSLFLLSSKS